ncbi:MAG: biotin transporter BioY [Candidatus Marinimicrobia bacterium]|jgi:biotin transport system substrate-specific component|nr:biotin transporter BioY [Candidatus Neomarinimicrobiota bacterium]
MIKAKVLNLRNEKLSILFNVMLVLSGSILIALFSQIAINIPFSLVPITGQTLAIMLVGALLGSKKGSLSVITYLTEGVIGIPVFANFSGGIQHLIGPTGGYLISFVFVAFIIGYLFEKGFDKSLIKNLIAIFLSHIIIFGIGLTWLGLYIGSDKVFAIGLFPFIPGAIIKISVFLSLVYGKNYLDK